MTRIRFTLQTMAHGGDALGRHEGKVVFVPYGIPGEEVTVEIVEAKKRYAHGRLIEVHTVSPHRTDPPCPHFGDCGGCHWQHVEYSAQLKYKQSIVTNVLTRIGKIAKPPVGPTIGMEEPWRYRNNMRFGTDSLRRLGLRARASHRIIPVESCLIIHPVLQELHDLVDLGDPTLRQLTFRCGTRTGDAMLIFEMANDQPPELETDTTLSCVLSLADGRSAVLIGSSHIYERLGELHLRISSGSFFQVNTSQAEKLVGVVRRYLEPTGDEVLLDAYCGVGTFGLAMADEVAAVIGIEESPGAIEDARINAEGLEHVSFYEGKVEEVLSGIEANVDLAILDPPRAGCQPAVLCSLMERNPRRIAYVSCDPATLARDLRVLMDGGYELGEVQPVDMFPQTAHIEAVALLTRDLPG